MSIEITGLDTYCPGYKQRLPEISHPDMGDIYREEVEILRRELQLKNETIRRLKLSIRRNHAGTNRVGQSGKRLLRLSSRK
jgi:hypothetical protein